MNRQKRIRDVAVLEGDKLSDLLTGAASGSKAALPRPSEAKLSYHLFIHYKTLVKTGESSDPYLTLCRVESRKRESNQ